MVYVLKAYKPKPRYIPKHIKHEETLQKQVCSYLRIQYPYIIFRSDFSSGLHLTPYQAKTHRSLQSSRAFPDLFIYEPRYVNGVQYAGLALELKKDKTAIVVKQGPRKGHIVTDPHIQEQVLMLKELKKKGYYATIACGIDQALAVTDWYLGKTILQVQSLF